MDISADVRAAAGVDPRLSACVDVASVLAADIHATGADRSRTRSLRDGAVASEVRLVGGVARCGSLMLVRLEFDEATRGQLVQLLIEMKFQSVDVLVAGVKMSQCIQLLLERR